MADGIYSGGIPNQGFNGTFPSSSGSESVVKPEAGPAEINTVAGNPAASTGSSDLGIIDSKDYEGPGDLDPTGGMKIVDLDDIKNTV